MFDLDEHLHYLQRVRERTRRVALCIPPEHIEWTYRSGAFTLGDLVRHIAVTERFIWAETIHNRPSAYVTHGRELAEGRDAVLALFDRLHEESVALFRQLTPEMLAGKCTTPEGTALTRWKWLRMLPEHEIHHRGQIYTMLGMLNVPTPPLYGMTSAEVRARGKDLGANA
ncbi:MAG TPA: DinB family protein [Vicinamibacterales bacterium]|nr:DinB family protein [Vicinamibacterales bacterium]